MPNTLLLTARNWLNVGVPCQFKVTANRKPLAPAGKSTSLYEIPPGTTEAAVWATPTSDTYATTIIPLSVSSSGAMAVAGNHDAKATVRNVAGANTVGTFLNIKVSRFQNVTLQTFELLKDPPKTRWQKKKTIKNGKTVWEPIEYQRNEVTRHKNVYGTWPPEDVGRTEWKLRPVKGAHFRDPKIPLQGDALNFERDASLTVEGKTVVLRRFGKNFVPKLFAVVWPKAIAPKANASPTPFLLFIRQRCGQDADVPGKPTPGLFTGGKPGLYPPYPDNFDYVERCLFEILHYGKTTIVEPPDWLLRPKGVPYQVAKAKADVVTVVPANSVGKEFAGLGNTENTREILEELQALMFWDAGVPDPPKSIGKTAIACFSAGAFDLIDWLNDATNRKGDFLANKVKAVYFLDPSPAAIDASIAAAKTWAGAGSDKRIRVYLRAKNVAAHKQLLGTNPPATPYFEDSPDGKKTLAVIPPDTWTKTFKKVFNRDVKINGWEWAVHHYIAATMLTHALAQGDI